MRIRNRKTLVKHNTIVVVLFFIPLLLVLSYLGLFLYILYDISSYNLEMPPPDPEYLYDLNEINENTLDKLAHTYEYQMKYHIDIKKEVEQAKIREVSLAEQAKGIQIVFSMLKEQLMRILISKEQEPLLDEAFEKIIAIVKEKVAKM